MSDSMNEDLEDGTWFTIFDWRIDVSPIHGAIRSRKGSLTTLRRFAAKRAGSHLIFGIEHEFEEECKGLAKLLRRQLSRDRVVSLGFAANDHFFNCLVDTFLAISTGAWERWEWEWLEEHSSPVEYEVLLHPKDFSLQLLSPCGWWVEEQDVPTVLTMQAILQNGGAATHQV